VAVADDGTIAVGDFRHDRVYLFGRDEGRCVLLSTIPGEPGSWFGFALASDRRQLLIGAPRSGGTGAAFLYDLDTKSLQPVPVPQAGRGDEVGSSVAIDDGNLVIGARGADSRRGRVYFRFEGSFGVVPVVGLAPNAELGQSVALSSTTLVLGAPHPYRASGSPGAAWVFDLGSRTLLPLTPPGGLEPEAAFGYAVAVAGKHILVGAPLADGAGTDAGAVYSFRRRDDGTWEPAAPHPLLAGGRGDQLGVAIALEGRTAVIGARYAENTRGAAYLIGMSGGALTLRARETVPAGAQLGFSVAIRNGTVVVGAFREGRTGAAYEFVPAIRLDLEVAKVQESARTVTVTVRATERVSRDVTVQISTEDGTATAGADYRALSGHNVTLRAGETSADVTIEILQDSRCEDQETFLVDLFDPPGGEAVQTVTVTIVDDDPGDLELAPDPPRTFEDGTPAPLSVRLTCPPFAPVKVSLEGPAGFSPAELTFTEEDWSRPQTVSVTGPDNETCETVDISYPVRATATSADDRYDGVSRTIFAENADDELACLSITERTVCTDDGGTVVYTIALSNEASDGPGAPAELRDILPSGITVVTASADRGIATADPVANSVRWTGTVPAAGDGAATITIVAALDELPGPVLENRADLFYVRDGRGHRETLPVAFEDVEILPCPE
jgi:uncharacterized repeat protein (TIGR01451 family)